MSRPWLVEVISVGAASAGAVAWRRSGKLHLSAIVKATFAFAPSAPMTPALPVPIRAAEVLQGEGPDGSVREPADTAPALRFTDVLFAGHACAPAVAPAPRLAARLALRASDGKMLVDKYLEVLGDRLFIPGRPPPEPAPFTRIPVTYERAYGGPDHSANPVGMGQLAELAGRRRLPNIVHPEKPQRPAVEPAGFGPISFRWPLRRRMLRVTPRHVLDLPIAEIPDDLDPLYFQAAPADQRTRFLQGDEWLILQCLNPVHPVLETQIPGARGVARVYLPDGSSPHIALVADTLFVDGDAEQCSITWRGSFPIPSEADLPSIGIAAGVELPGMPVPLPDRFPRVQLPEVARRPPPPLPAGRQRTVLVDTAAADELAARLAAVARMAPDVPLDGLGTLLLSGETPPPVNAPVGPPAPRGRQSTTVIAPPEPRRSLEATVIAPLVPPPSPGGRQSTTVIAPPVPPPSPGGRHSTTVIAPPVPPPGPEPPLPKQLQNRFGKKI
ncbi:MAG: DUF2169 domain-containing protein [Minicystis sp.]